MKLFTGILAASMLFCGCAAMKNNSPKQGNEEKIVDVQNAKSILDQVMAVKEKGGEVDNAMLHDMLLAYGKAQAANFNTMTLDVEVKDEQFNESYKGHTTVYSFNPESMESDGFSVSTKTSDKGNEVKYYDAKGIMELKENDGSKAYTEEQGAGFMDNMIQTLGNQGGSVYDNPVATITKNGDCIEFSCSGEGEGRKENETVKMYEDRIEIESVQVDENGKTLTEKRVITFKNVSEDEMNETQNEFKAYTTSDFAQAFEKANK